MARRLIVAVAILGIVVAACGGGPRGELDAARESWAESGVDDYRMRVTNSCFCTLEWVGPFDVTVQDGEIVEVVFDGAVIEPGDSHPDHLFTVERLFDFIDRKLDTADEIHVTYGEDGHPVTIDIDNIVDAVDDEDYISVTLELP